MDYRMHYERLIERAKTRMLTGYVETHHILPRCMGGTNARGNLVQLTAEEHFVAHQLLHKINPNVSGLAFAMIAMTGNPHGKRCNKAYGWIRKHFAIEASATTKAAWEDPAFRERHAVATALVRARPGYREQFSKLHKGRVKSPQERANIAEAGRNRKPRVFSAEARANMAAARKKTWEERRQKGEHLLIAAKTRATRIKNGTYSFSEEHKAAIGRASKIVWKKRKQTRGQVRLNETPPASNHACIGK